MRPEPSALLLEYLYFFESVQSPIKLVGGHGKGKTELIAEYAAYLGYKHHNIRAAHFSDVDVNGYPVEDGETLSWLPPRWLMDACNEPTILFLDEINRGKEIVRNCFLQLTDSRRINEHVLHPKTRIFSAVNPDNEKYFVNPYDAAELDRWFVLNFDPPVSVWTSWAKSKQVHPVVIQFIETFPTFLDPGENDDPQAKGPSRRSWKRLSDSLCLLEPPTDSMGMSLACGHVGKDAGYHFWKFYKANRTQIVNQNVLEKIKKHNISFDEFAACLDGGQDFWRTLFDNGLLADFLYSTSVLRNMEAFAMMETSLYNIKDPVLFKQILSLSYVRGNKQMTFADDIKHEKSITKMKMGL